MATLLKCCKPLFSTHLPFLSNSVRTIRLSAPRPRTFSKLTTRSVRCLAPSSSPSPPSVAKTIGAKSDDSTAEIPLSPELWVYNTMSRKKEVFRPKVEGKVGMYVCGVTAYDLSHIGHARVYVTFDVLYRYLRHLGYQVCYVRNFTDVDDKDSIAESALFKFCR